MAGLTRFELKVRKFVIVPKLFRCDMKEKQPCGRFHPSRLIGLSKYSRFLDLRKLTSEDQKTSILQSFFSFLTSKITVKSRFDVFEVILAFLWKKHGALWEIRWIISHPSVSSLALRAYSVVVKFDHKLKLLR